MSTRERPPAKAGGSVFSLAMTGLTSEQMSEWSQKTRPLTSKIRNEKPTVFTVGFVVGDLGGT
jgi:hypothetical protein